MDHHLPTLTIGQREVKTISPPWKMPSDGAKYGTQPHTTLKSYKKHTFHLPVSLSVTDIAAVLLTTRGIFSGATRWVARVMGDSIMANSVV